MFVNHDWVIGEKRSRMFAVVSVVRVGSSTTCVRL